MAEPTTAAAATLATASAAVPGLVVAGVHLGLRPDMLLAGFAGALAAIVLLNSVPLTGDSLAHMLRTTLRRIGVALTSALVAGYMTPALMFAAQVNEQVGLGVAFAAGAGAQGLLRAAVRRLQRLDGQSGAA